MDVFWGVAHGGEAEFVGYPFCGSFGYTLVVVGVGGIHLFFLSWLLPGGEAEDGRVDVVCVLCGPVGSRQIVCHND